MSEDGALVESVGGGLGLSVGAGPVSVEVGIGAGSSANAFNEKPSKATSINRFIIAPLISSKICLRSWLMHYLKKMWMNSGNPIAFVAD